MPKLSWLRPLALVAGLVLAAGAALAAVPVSTSLVVEPANPTTADSIRVRETTVYPQTCWGDLATTCSGPVADTLVMETRVQYCGGFPSCLCLATFDSHTRRCTFAPLPAGTYTVVFRDLHDVNPEDRMATFTLVASFTVDESTPSARRSWGALKIHHR
jgi:hypothetical protein